MITQATSISQNRAAELALLIEGLTARLQAGEPLNMEDVVREHPEHAEELQELLPAMSLLVNLSRSAAAPAAPEFNDAPLVELGDFRIVREVGRGGMGVVYEAQQVSLGRRVALKVLPTTATLDPRQRERFKNEAKAVASLRHKHIVHVYGVGCEHGVHYYAMQFIEGQTLAALIHDLRVHASLETVEPDAIEEAETGPYATQGAMLSPPNGGVGREASLGEAAKACHAVDGSPDTTAHARATHSTEHSHKDAAFFRTVVNLGRQAALALEYAHQMGIVHRDIKLANLMVDAHGNLWVTDFGLAQV